VSKESNTEANFTYSKITEIVQINWNVSNYVSNKNELEIT